MDIVIRNLTPELIEDYIRFFDDTPHDDNNDENKCYCVCWCSANTVCIVQAGCLLQGVGTTETDIEKNSKVALLFLTI